MYFRAVSQTERLAATAHLEAASADGWAEDNPSSVQFGHYYTKSCNNAAMDVKISTQSSASLGEKPCPKRPALQIRPLLSNSQADDLELLFRLMGNATRLKILHCLVREGELRVGELCELIGLQTQCVSNQLRNLAAAGVVIDRRCGTNIHYRVVDDCVLELLERGLCQRECVKERGPSCGSEGCCNE